VPDGAIVRTLSKRSGQRFYEYTITVAQCIAAACVSRAVLMNGSCISSDAGPVQELQRVCDRRRLPESRVRPDPMGLLSY